MGYEGDERRKMERRADHPPVTLRWLNRRLIVVVSLICLGISTIVGAGTARLVQDQTNDGFRDNAINACDGQNLLRGYARIAVPRASPQGDLAYRLLRVRDCAKTFDTEKIVVLPRSLEDNYLDALRRGDRVAARDSGRRLDRIP